jgi:molybdate transport system substrate-binding protein
MSSRSAVLAGLFAVCALLPEVAGAAEIRLLSANVFTGVLDGPIKDFERASGHSVVIIYATAGNIKGRVQSGEPGDVTIVTRPMMDELEKSGKIVPGTRVDLARSAVALVVRSGASKPDISSVDASSMRCWQRIRSAIPTPPRVAQRVFSLPVFSSGLISRRR